VFGRGQKQTRQDLARAEFGQSIDHFRKAATYAAGGIGATVGPRMGLAKGRVGSARGYIGPSATRVSQAASQGWDMTIAFVGPLAEAAKQGSIRAARLPDATIKKSGNGKGKGNGNGNGGTRGSTMASIVAAGAAIGATGALVARRRNRSKWAEYEPSTLQGDAEVWVDETRTAGRGGDDRPRAASKMSGWAKDHSKSAVGTVREKIQDGKSRRTTGDATMADSAPGGLSDMGDDMRGNESGTMSDAGDAASGGAHHMSDKTEAKLNDAGSRRGNKSGKSANSSASPDDMDSMRSNKERPV